MKLACMVESLLHLRQALAFKGLQLVAHFVVLFGGGLRGGNDCVNAAEKAMHPNISKHTPNAEG
jgi:hypothetical protein